LTVSLISFPAMATAVPPSSCVVIGGKSVHFCQVLPPEVFLCEYAINEFGRVAIGVKHLPLR
jgi:hypothetical protein